MGKNKKISDKEFLTLLRENGGLFARTSKAIKAQFDIEYSRQAVRDRALKNPKELADIEEENLDIAEEGLHSLMKSEDERIKLRSIEIYLKTKGRKRGYLEKEGVTESVPNIVLTPEERTAKIKEIRDKVLLEATG